MLNKTVCWKCFFKRFHSTLKEEGRYYVTGTEAKLFEKRFKDGRCAVNPFQAALEPTNNPPEECPFIVEHVVNANAE